MEMAKHDLITKDFALYVVHYFASMLTWSKKDILAEIDRTIKEAKPADAVPVVRCKDCKHLGIDGECPMYHVDEIEWDDDGYTEVDYVPHDYTIDEGFCDRGERRTDNA